MGESTNPRAKLRFDRRVRLEFHGATITSDAGLLACRELDDALGLTETADECLQESRGGRNVQHRLVGLLRQSVYSRLAGYEDTNDAERLADDPTMRVIVGDRGIDRPAASTNTMSRFETEVLTQDGNVEGLGRLNAVKNSRIRPEPSNTPTAPCRASVSERAPSTISWSTTLRSHISVTRRLTSLILSTRARRVLISRLRASVSFEDPSHAILPPLEHPTAWMGCECHELYQSRCHRGLAIGKF